jgi:hypothetical protein
MNSSKNANPSAAGPTFLIGDNVGMVPRASDNESRCPGGS